MDKIRFEPLNEYEQVFADFVNHLRTIQKMVEFFPDIRKQYEEKTDKEAKEFTKTLSPVERKQALEAVELLLNQAQSIKKFPDGVAGKLFFKNKNVPTLLSKAFDHIQLSRDISTYIHETSLVYLITIFEVFEKDNLKLVFESDQRNLKSEKEMTHKEILEATSLEELKTKILEKEVNELLDKDIKKMGKKLAMSFKTHLTADDNWVSFTERFSRRNIIVHNNSIPDNKYHLETGSDVKSIITDQEYILKSIDLFYEFAEKISKSFQKHFPITT